MVRKYILNDSQRDSVEQFLKTREWPMPTTIRQIRHRVDNELLDTMEEDLQILRKLINIDVPIGRRSSEVASKLTVRTKKDGEMRAGFNINKPKEKQK